MFYLTFVFNYLFCRLHFLCLSWRCSVALKIIQDNSSNLYKMLNVKTCLLFLSKIQLRKMFLTIFQRKVFTYNYWSIGDQLSTYKQTQKKTCEKFFLFLYFTNSILKPYRIVLRTTICYYECLNSKFLL